LPLALHLPKGEHLVAKPIVDDSLWARLEPLLPLLKPRRTRSPGRKPITNRQALTGILHVLKTGIPWKELPREMGCGSGMTCWRRLLSWHRAGVWQQIQAVLSLELTETHRIDWSRAELGIISQASERANHHPSPSRSEQESPRLRPRESTEREPLAEAAHEPTFVDYDVRTGELRGAHYSGDDSSGNYATSVDDELTTDEHREFWIYQ
jgi:transposase